MSVCNYVVMSPNNIIAHLEEKSGLDMLKKYIFVSKVTKGMAYRLCTGEVELKASEKLATPISSKWLTKNLKNGYKLIINDLHGNFIYKYPYEVKKNPFLFCFNNETINSGFSCVEIPLKTYKEKRFINNLFEGINKIPNNVKQKFNFTIKFFTDGKLTIDWKKAIVQLEEEYEQDKNLKKYLINIQKILNIYNGDFKFSHNENTDGRLHNEFVRLNKSLRKYLSYDSEELFEIDISNSVPFMLSTILYNNKHSNIIQIDNKIINTLISYMSKETTESPMHREIEEFCKLSSTGELYESLMEVFQSNYNEVKEYISKTIASNRYCYKQVLYYENIDFDDKSAFRKFIKKEFLAMLFSKNSTYDIMENIFSKKFPKLMKLIRELKKGNHKMFANCLFQFESNLVLNILAKEFNKKNRGRIPIFTIHDCLVTTKRHGKKLLEFCQNKLKELFDYPPNLKYEVWN